MNTKKLRSLAMVGSVAMVGACAWAMWQKPIHQSWNEMWPDPWFKVTMLDLYLGFTIMAVWMWHDRLSVIEKIAWTIAFAGLGNIGVLAYVARRLLRSKA